MKENRFTPQQLISLRNQAQDYINLGNGLVLSFIYKTAVYLAAFRASDTVLPQVARVNVPLIQAALSVDQLRAQAYSDTIFSVLPIILLGCCVLDGAKTTTRAIQAYGTGRTMLKTSQMIPVNNDTSGCMDTSEQINTGSSQPQPPPTV